MQAQDEFTTSFDAENYLDSALAAAGFALPTAYRTGVVMNLNRLHAMAIELQHAQSSEPAEHDPTT